jgi:hypothetical protein
MVVVGGTIYAKGGELLRMWCTESTEGEVVPVLNWAPCQNEVRDNSGTALLIRNPITKLGWAIYAEPLLTKIKFAYYDPNIMHTL